MDGWMDALFALFYLGKWKMDNKIITVYGIGL
jgi:hypothetical protein